MSPKLSAGLYHQAIWLTCVLGAARGYPLMATLLGTLLLISQLRAVGKTRVQEVFWISGCVMLGGSIDSLLTVSGHFNFNLAGWPAVLAPPWLLVIWAAFAVVVAEFASLIRQYLWISLPLFTIGAPLTYYAGYKFGAVLMPTPAKTLVLMAIIWSLLMLVLVWGRSRFERLW